MSDVEGFGDGVSMYRIAMMVAAVLSNLAVLNADPPQPENIVFIMLDDADYFDVGFNAALLNAPDAITPNIDWLCANGRKFTQFYSASCVCTPTRVSVLTGQNPIRHGAVDAWPSLEFVAQANSGMSGLPNSGPMLGHEMRAAGKRTGFYGKWHVGLNREEYRPSACGFDRYMWKRSTGFGSASTTQWHGVFAFNSESGPTLVDVDYIDTYFADNVIGFIDDCVADSQPFFVSFCPYTPHYPLTPPRDFDNSETNFDLTTHRGKLLAMMYAIDEEIGRIVDVLDDHEILENTLIVVTSDNGGFGLTRHPEAFLRGSKGAFLEGGIRVPMVAHWPEGIPGGSTNGSVMTTYDLLPTFAELTGRNASKLYKKIDGRSFAAAFHGNAVLEHEPILWQVSGGPTRPEDERAQPTYAYRDGNYKLVKYKNRHPFTHPYAFVLYDVVSDPQESTNLVGNTPLFDSMFEKMQSARKEISRYDGFPKRAGNKSVRFDPRLDVNSKSMTLKLNLKVPKKILSSPRNVYDLPGAQRLTLSATHALRWRVHGADAAGAPVTVTLRAPKLSPGYHEIVMSVGGFKADVPRLELYVDGLLVDELENHPSAQSMQNLWTTTSDAVLGDRGVKIRDARFHTLKLWPDEW